jgi:hypothetical protein
MFAYLRREGQRFPHAQTVDGEIVGRVRGWARELSVRILAGSIAESLPGTGARAQHERARGRRRRDRSGLPQDPPVRRRSRRERRGVHRIEEHRAGRRGGGGRHRDRRRSACRSVTTCASPELYRAHAARGARWLTVPSAFARASGKDHWEVLLRARAIENQCFVLAPAQCGVHSPERASHGRSLIVDPWGIVLAQLGRLARRRGGRLLARRARARRAASVPALRHRKLTPAFRYPKRSSRPP